jgi:hypothetical protein
VSATRFELTIVGLDGVEPRGDVRDGGSRCTNGRSNGLHSLAPGEGLMAFKLDRS